MIESDRVAIACSVLMTTLRIKKSLTTWWHDGETARRNHARQLRADKKFMRRTTSFFLSLISILFTVLWLDIRTMVLKPFYHIFGSCSPAKSMVYEISETDRVAMVCSVLQPCLFSSSKTNTLSTFPIFVICVSFREWIGKMPLTSQCILGSYSMRFWM